MPALGLAPLAIFAIAFVIFSLYWIMLTSGNQSADVGPFSIDASFITDFVRTQIRAVTFDIIDTLFPESLAFVFETSFQMLDDGQSVWAATVYCITQVFQYTEETTKEGIRTVINWAYGRDIQAYAASTQTGLETLLGSAHTIANTLDVYTYFFGTVDMQIANIYSALSEIGQVTFPMVYTLLGGLAHGLENAIGGLLGLEGVIVPGIQTEVVNLQGVVAFINGVIALDQPLIDGWVTDIPNIKGRLKELEDILTGLAGAIPLTPEMVAELTALAALAGLSAVAIETLVRIAENPCSIAEMCNFGGGRDSLVEAAAIANMLGFN